MLIPDRVKKVRTWKIPTVVVHTGAFLAAVLLLLMGILIYDYWRVLTQIYENKYLAAENHQLREQVQIFQMKLNSLTQDLDRIHIFEKKLRIISGLENTDLSKGSPFAPAPSSLNVEGMLPPDETGGSRAPQGEQDSDQTSSDLVNETEQSLAVLNKEDLSSEPEVIQLENFYQNKLGESLGIEMGMAYQGPLNEVFQRLLKVAPGMALFDFKYNKLKLITADLEVRLSDLDQYLLDRESFMLSTPTILPALGWLTSFFGQRISPISGQPRFHEGLDVGASIGTDIHASADGTVTFAGNRPGLGNYIQIDHGYGIETIYAHASALTVRAGVQVKRGDLIARVGSTGYSTAPHLHYEIRVNGVAVDPLYYILN